MFWIPVCNGEPEVEGVGERPFCEGGFLSKQSRTGAFKEIAMCDVVCGNY